MMHNKRYVGPILGSLCLVCLIVGTLVPTGSIRSANDDPTKVDDLAFIAGQWRGEAFGGICEEVWNAPSGNSMMGMFKLIQQDRIVFYELMIIAEDSAGIALKLKHFNADLTGWETKDDMVTFPFVKMQNNKAIFEGISFHRKTTDTLLVTLTTEHDGKIDTTRFVYLQVKE
ncbi:MAG: DUF6265 family protein [candidate division Zixibacteria bacterium]|nr:DUF6265 family protein [candidate division Zixibacteria bacterium]MDH3937069.1 DUF6265 family protein [candidate division Zixibacteria bacterium]MDH4034012.1 DUF6265 family protein [candidate division Zixibacteria bacterium]